MTGVRPIERSLLGITAVICLLAGVADHQVWAPIPRFAIATLALMGLAWVVSFATEQVGEHLGAGVTGVLGATLANLPELLVVIFALKANELVVAQTAIVGSMLANALLLLGIVLIVGARRSSDGVMRFSRQLPQDTTTMLLFMLFILVLIGPSLGSADRASHHIHSISAVGAVCLLAVYGIWLTRYLRSASPVAESAIGARMRLVPAIALLVGSGIVAGFVCEWFVNSLTPAISSLHLSKAFAGLVIVAIAGNAVEHAASVVLAARGQNDLAISVVKNSVGQIAGFLFPVLVLISLTLSTHLTFELPAVYIAALALMAIMVWQITGDGRATIFEGAALAAAYVVLAVVAAYQ